MLNQIKIILVQTSHSGNIGSSARAMATMGFKHLVLVDPKSEIDAQAIAMSSGAEHILEQAQIVGSLEEALADCYFAIATSARSRSISWPLLPPEQAAAKVAEKVTAGKVAVVFGCEKFGLSNEQLQQCDAHMTIPTSDEFRSLNLSQAVQIVVYELRQAILGHACFTAEYDEQRTLASHRVFDGFIEHLQQTLTDIKFINPKQPKMLMSRLRRLFQRAELDDKEINILRGILAAMDKQQ